MSSYQYRNYTVGIRDGMFHVHEIDDVSYPTQEEAHAAIDERVQEVHLDEGRSTWFHQVLWKMGLRHRKAGNPAEDTRVKPKA